MSVKCNHGIFIKREAGDLMQPERREAKTKAEVESNVAASPEMIAAI